MGLGPSIGLRTLSGSKYASKGDGLPGGSWAIFLLHFGVFVWSLCSECSPKGLGEASGVDFGSILAGFGGVWEGSGHPKLGHLSFGVVPSKRFMQRQ